MHLKFSADLNGRVSGRRKSYIKRPERCNLAKTLLRIRISLSILKKTFQMKNRHLISNEEIVRIMIKLIYT